MIERSRRLDDSGDGDRLLRAVVRREGRWLVPLVALGVVGAGALLALPAVLGRAVDQVVAAAGSASSSGGGSGSGSGDWAAARGSLVLAAALVGVLVVEEAVGQLVGGVGAAGAAGALRRRLVRHVLAAGPGVARRTAAGDLVARLIGGAAATARVVTVVAGLSGALIPPVGGVVALALIDPWLAVTFVGGMALAGGAVRSYLRDARSANVGYLEAQGAIAGRLVDALAGARTIAAARAEDREVARILGPLPALRRHGLAAWRTMAQLAFQGEPVVLLTQVAVVTVAGLGLAAGRLSAGEMLAASRYAVMAAGIGGLIGQLSGLTRARAGAERVAGVLGEPVTSYGERPLPGGPGRLEFRAVTAGPPPVTAPGHVARATTAPAASAPRQPGTAHAWATTAPAGTPGPAGSTVGQPGTAGAGTAAAARGPGGRAVAPVLDGLELVVPGGQVVALVGRSGAGKSLMAALAGRLCDPAAGEVRLDGVPLRQLSRRALRHGVAYAFERPALLGGTVGEAIGFGLGPWRRVRRRVRRAATAARADRFIARLPGGYEAPRADTPMSGGELQRIGLARALAREARVVVLDDATSSLDTATEAEIAAALTSRAPGRRRQTRLIVTHRTTTAARADLVAWLDGGRIRALGPHRRLWADPDYRAIFRPEPATPQPAPAPVIPRTEPAPEVGATSPTSGAGSRRAAAR